MLSGLKSGFGDPVSLTTLHSKGARVQQRGVVGSRKGLHNPRDLYNPHSIPNFGCAQGVFDEPLIWDPPGERDKTLAEECRFGLHTPFSTFNLKSSKSTR